MVFSFDAEVAVGKPFHNARVGTVSTFDDTFEYFMDGVAKRPP